MDRQRERLIFAHQEWLGFVQPEGLVVSPTVMVEAQVVPDRNVAERQREFRELLRESRGETTSRWRFAGDLRRLFVDWLDWEEGDLVDAEGHRDSLEVALPELGTVLAPTWAVPGDDGVAWTMLIRVEEDGADLDRPPDDGAGWSASRQARFERLLRETGIPVGLLCTGERVRLVYAPWGETSGHATFEFSQMALPAGRPILAAFDMLLSADRLFGGTTEERLPALLAESRERQAEVSTRLSRQVLAALHELLRGLVAADARGGQTTELAQSDPDQLYGGLITTLMRLVFVLYAEDRGLMPDHEVYQQHYSLGGLFARLRDDEAAWPDTMDQRFGAWAQLLSLFRLVHSGGGHGCGLQFVARKGTLFDPDRFPFLEGRGPEGDAQIPLVPDSTVWNVLQSLMVLDGERLSYRTLDVEQIGSVYEAIMGFRVELTTGRSIAVSSPKRSGAAAIVDLDRLLGVEGGQRPKALQDATDRKLTGKALAALRQASTVEDLVVALERVIDQDATPDMVGAWVPVLQPTDERRRSGSHYTPRSLTEPIVAEALRPIFERLGEDASPEDILDLRVLDPATGSGAFLVEACRQLAERLVRAWAKGGGTSELAPDMDELLHAQRLVAQRCLYGVDRNPMAIDLARLSLWLATLAKDHEFTFVDHALRCGDSLVGLDIPSIEALDWKPRRDERKPRLIRTIVEDRLAHAKGEFQRLREAVGERREEELRPMLDRARAAVGEPRLIGDALVSAYFAADTKKERVRERHRVSEPVEGDDSGWQERLEALAARLRDDDHGIDPFHWQIEFLEVFERGNPGFDAIIGNPPFAGKNTLAAANPANYPAWLKEVHPESHGNADLVAHFYRRSFDLLREGGTLGLIATNTIGQGDTRSTGLRWICKHGGEVYRVRRRLKWPGEAAVVVSVVHIAKGGYCGPKMIDGREVERITAFLFHDGGHDDPERLEANTGRCFQGSIVLGKGFTFDDTDTTGMATPIREMQRLISADSRNQEVILPYIGGDEVNSSPTHSHHRYVINFRDYPLRRAELGATWREVNEKRRQDWRRDGVVPPDYPYPVASDWPELLKIVESLVMGTRASHSTARWWHFERARPELYAAIEGLDRVMFHGFTCQHMQFCFLAPDIVFSGPHNVFVFRQFSAFCVLQTRPHEVWTRFLASTLGDGLRYTPTDCFENFPFPENWETHLALETAGKAYYAYRAALMVENDEGMTKTYNRFHDRDERNPDIVRLRELHAEMDRAVLDAYGWNDIPTDCEFLLDYEIDEENWGRRKKPYRYRWPDEVREEVLARLLALNAERAAEERLAGA